MFRQACKLYKTCICPVGAGADGKPSIFTGQGCMLSKTYIITSFHTFSTPSRDHGYKWPEAMLWDGRYRCEVVLADETADIALYRVADRIEAFDLLPAPVNFPEISTESVEQGMAVGYMANFEKTDAITKEIRRYTLFSSAYTSFGLLRPGLTWVLSGGFGEPGFSGAPVFLPDARLVGVLGAAWQTAARSELDSLLAGQDHSIRYSMPALLPVTQYRDQIGKITKAGK